MRSMVVMAAAACATLLSTAVATPAAAEDRFDCTCKGIASSSFGNAPVPGRGCGNGFRGGDNGQVVSSVSSTGLYNMLPPYNRGQLVRNQSNSEYSPISGWECRRL